MICPTLCGLLEKTPLGLRTRACIYPNSHRSSYLVGGAVYRISFSHGILQGTDPAHFTKKSEAQRC